MKAFCLILPHIAVALGMLSPLRGWAADCQLTAAVPASFGIVTSFNVANQSQSTSTTSVGLTCPGASLGLASFGNYIGGTVRSVNRGKLVGPTGDAIPYNIYQNSSYNTQLILGNRYDWYNVQWISIGGLALSSSSLPVYLRTVTGNNVAAGVYTDTLTVTWDWHVCTGLSFLICIGWSNGTGVTMVPITLTVSNDCIIAVADVNFGAVPTVSGFLPVTGAVSLTCTKGMTYSIGLSSGNYPHVNGRRQMANGANRLQYDIYRASSNAVWGQSINRVDSVGAADGISGQQFPYMARIYTDQATPAVGTYTDSVVIDVHY